MIVIPDEESGTDTWPPRWLGTIVAPDEPVRRAAAPDSDPVMRAETARASAGRAFDLVTATSEATRSLDELATTIDGENDWRDGIGRFDHGVAELRRRHGESFGDAEDRAAFDDHLDRFAALRRMDLRQGLTDGQHAEAFDTLEKTLAYYAGRAAQARYPIERDMFTDAGNAAIERLRSAGYMGPQLASLFQEDFQAQIGELGQAKAELATSKNPPPIAEPAAQNEASGASSEQAYTPENVPEDDPGPYLKYRGFPVREEEPLELSEEQVAKIIDGLLTALPLAGAGPALKLATQAARQYLSRRPKTSEHPENQARTPKQEPLIGDEGAIASDLPAGGIRHVSSAENLAHGRYAADQVLRNKTDVPEAMYREDVGIITFNYGRPGTPQKKYMDGEGLSHIVAKRNLDNADGESFVREELANVLARGRLERMKGPGLGRRAEIVFDNDMVVLSLHRHGQRESWVLTGYERLNSGSVGAGGVNPTGLRTTPPGVRSGVGAEPTKNIRAHKPTNNASEHEP